MIGGTVAGLIALSLATALFLNLRKLAKAQQALWKEAHEDALTSLPNRRLLTEHLEGLIRKKHSGEGAIFFVDLDRFKVVNDSMGHAFGDELLQQVAGRLSLLFRKSDIVARIGGDEFVIVVDEANRKSATALAERIITDISNPFHLGEDNNAHIGASVGIRLFTETSECTEQLIDDADCALYQAKLAGRGRYFFYTPAMKAALQHQLMVRRQDRRLDAVA